MEGEAYGANSGYQRELLQCMSPALAQSGHPAVLNQCPLLGKIGSLGVASLGYDPFKDGDVLVVEADWKKALRNRQRHHDLKISDRCGEPRKIGPM
jgi:hypothetical protein